MATYPAAVKSFTSKTDNVDTVNAADVNTAYDEITALENALGVNPAVTTSTLTGWVGTASTNWTTVGARLDNIERGVLGDAHGSIYVHQAGGDTIQSSGSVVPLTVRGGSGNLFVVKDSGATNRITVDAGGNTTFDGTLVTVNGILQAHTLWHNSNLMPFKMGCSITNITVGAGTSNAANNITLSGFTLPPIITATINSASGNAIQATLLVYNVTNAGFTLGLYTHANLGTTTTFSVFWHAIQGTSGTSTL